MIFVDTGAWFAAFVPNDPDHAAADSWLAENTELLVTTDYVLDELFTPLDFQTAWATYRQFHDKEWSFTDCTSRAVIERLSISTAFAFDEHFRQFGNVTVVPG